MSQFVWCAQPTAEQLEDLRFAWRCVKHVKSNAITVAKDQRLLGMGSGQPNRVKSVEIALEKAGADIKARPPFAGGPKGAPVTSTVWAVTKSCWGRQISSRGWCCWKSS